MSHINYTPPPRRQDASPPPAPPPPPLDLNDREWARLVQGKLLRLMLEQAEAPGLGREPNPVAAGIARQIINDVLDRPPRTDRELAALRGQTNNLRRKLPELG